MTKYILLKKKLKEQEEFRKSLTWVKMRKSSNDQYVAKMDIDGSDQNQGPSTSRPANWEQQKPEIEEIDSEWKKLIPINLI